MPETTPCRRTPVCGVAEHGTGENLDPKPAYLKRLGEIIDLRSDSQGGPAGGVRSHVGRGARILRRTAARAPACKSRPCTTIATCCSADTRRNPTIICSKICERRCARPSAQIGIATDGDADRFGIVDADGTFLQPNYVIALLFDYLVESRGWKNGVAKSVATTNLINALAEKHGVELHETPVGFKYIGELIMQDKIAIGGEESAGLSIRHHVPEKDGVLAGLAVLRGGGAPRQVAGRTVEGAV